MGLTTVEERQPGLAERALTYALRPFLFFMH
jgi:hypothetical protein